MLGWIGKDDFGVVERVDDESIATRFYTVIIPVWPYESRYHTRGRDGSPEVVALELHRTSVVLGFLRTPLWLATLMLAAPAFAVPARWSELLAVAIPLGVLASILTFVVGRASNEQRARRRLLRRVVGLGAPPELLPAELATRIRTALDDTWRDISDVPWPQAITNGVANELLVALAHYHARHALAEHAAANLARPRDP